MLATRWRLRASHLLGFVAEFVSRAWRLCGRVLLPPGTILQALLANGLVAFPCAIGLGADVPGKDGGATDFPPLNDCIGRDGRHIPVSGEA